MDRIANIDLGVCQRGNGYQSLRQQSREPEIIAPADLDRSSPRLSAKEALNWLLVSSEDLVLRALADLAGARPELLRRAALAENGAAGDRGSGSSRGGAQSSSGPTRTASRVVTWLLTTDEREVLETLATVSTARPGLVSEAARTAGLSGLSTGRPKAMTSSASARSMHRSLGSERSPGPVESGPVPRPFPGAAQMQSRRPSIEAAADAAPSQRPSARDPWPMGAAVRAPLKSASQERLAKEGEKKPLKSSPIVQFSCPIYYCNEDEGHIDLDVTRFGDTSIRSEVAFHTSDGSAKAGNAFGMLEGTLVFEPGETEKHIQVPLFGSEVWVPTIEFKCELVDKGLKNCCLGRYLRNCRIKIIDSGFFPSSRYEDEIAARKVDKIPKVSLFYEYVRLNLQNPIVYERTKKCLMIDQLHNLYMLLQLFVNVYLVDYVLNTNCTDLVFVDERHSALLLILVAKMVPFAAVHIADHMKVAKVGTAPASLKTLRGGLLSKFLNADRVARSLVNQGDLIMSLTRDSNLLVHDGFDNVLVVCQQLGQLLATLVYQLIAPVVFGKPFSIIGFCPLLIFPVVMLTFLSCRMPTTVDLLEDRNTKSNRVVDYVEEKVSNYKLIADYNRRDRCVDDFEDVLLDYSVSARSCGLMLSNNHYFTLWLMLGVVSVYTLIGGTSVVEGDMSLGMFLTNINIFTLIGGACTAIYDKFLIITGTFPALERIVDFMNLPMDVSQRKLLTRRRQEASSNLRKELAAQNEDGMEIIDLMPIVVGNLNFSYVTSALTGEDEARVTTMNYSGIMKVQQGEFCAFIGPNSGGKATLLRILGGEILVDPEMVSTRVSDESLGQMFVPSHLRVLHVQPTPMFFNGTLLENLAFGADAKEDGKLSRVLAICERLGIAQEVVCHAEDNGCHRWMEVFSATQCQSLSLARALVANPEILCMHKPTQVFDDEKANAVGAVLREFVDERGVAVSSLTSFNHRRPRTCLVSAAGRRRMLKFADRTYRISQDNGIAIEDPGGGDSPKMSR